MTLHIRRLKDTEVLDYYRVVSLVEESFKRPFPGLYRELFNVSNTLACYSLGEVVGGAIYHFSPQTSEGFLKFLAVSENVRRRGIGTALVKEGEEIAKSRSIKKIILDPFNNSEIWYAKLHYGHSLTRTTSSGVHLMEKEFTTTH